MSLVLCSDCSCLIEVLFYQLLPPQTILSVQQASDVSFMRKMIEGVLLGIDRNSLQSMRLSRHQVLGRLRTVSSLRPYLGLYVRGINSLEDEGVIPPHFLDSFGLLFLNNHLAFRILAALRSKSDRGLFTRKLLTDIYLNVARSLVYHGQFTSYCWFGAKLIGLGVITAHIRLRETWRFTAEFLSISQLCRSPEEAWEACLCCLHGCWTSDPILFGSHVEHVSSTRSLLLFDVLFLFWKGAGIEILQQLGNVELSSFTEALVVHFTIATYL